MAVWCLLSVAPYVSSCEDVVRKMLDMARLAKGEVLYDLGCGDGRIVMIAVRDYSAKAFGVEIREDLAEAARERLRKLGLEGRGRIIHGDLFQIDLSKADVVTLYLTPSGNEKLKPKLEKELRQEVRVASHDFSIPGWEPTETSRELPAHTVYLYRVGTSHAHYLAESGSRAKSMGAQKSGDRQDAG